MEDSETVSITGIIISAWSMQASDNRTVALLKVGMNE
jgi:hypothetical protein